MINRQSAFIFTLNIFEITLFPPLKDNIKYLGVILDNMFKAYAKKISFPIRRTWSQDEIRKHDSIGGGVSFSIF